MRKENHKRRRIADKEQSIIKKELKKYKDASTDFVSHKAIKVRLSAAQISKTQYNKILRVLKEFKIWNYSTRGVRFKKADENE